MTRLQELATANEILLIRLRVLRGRERRAADALAAPRANRPLVGARLLAIGREITDIERQVRTNLGEAAERLGQAAPIPHGPEAVLACGLN